MGESCSHNENVRDLYRLLSNKMKNDFTVYAVRNFNKWTDIPINLYRYSHTVQIPAVFH